MDEHTQASVLPEYQGVKLKDVEVESDLFEDMKFCEFSVTDICNERCFMSSRLVVSSDPKSRTGDQDKKELMKLFAIPL